MARNRWIQVIALAVMALCVAGAGLMLPSIDRTRADLQLRGLGMDGGKDLSAAATLATPALATFRGLWVDVMWYRANRLKEEGKFFEINQLAETITELQPRFPQVWSFHAWNMAYNISVATHTPDERWDWVNKGITLLRDKGIPYNPRAIRLYRELGWIFFHKVGQYSDDMNWYYKTRLATEWQEFLGAPGEGASTDQAIAEFARIAEAPDKLDSLLSEKPEAAPLVERLRGMGYKIDEQLLRNLGRVLMWTYSIDVNLSGMSLDNLPDEQRRLAEVMRDPKLKPGVEPLLAHLRKRTLIDHYKMDPAYMLELMRMFGPLDWRHAASHACYWASLGTKMAEALRNTKDVDLLNTYRGSIHALQEMMFRGRMSFDPITGNIDLMPDPRFIAAYEKAKFEAELHITGGKYGSGTTDSFNAGHENFLKTAVLFSYLYGDESQAQEYYDRARDLYGSRPESIERGRYEKTLSEFIVEELTANWDLQYNARAFVDGMLTTAFSKGLANNRRDVFDKFMTVAKQVYDNYMKSTGGTPTPNATRDRMSLLPWPQLVSETYISFFRSPNISPLTRFRVWANTPNDIRRVVFDRLRDPVRAQAAQMGFDPEAAFSEPPGMAEYREDNPVAPPTANDGAPPRDPAGLGVQRN